MSETHFKVRAALKSNGDDVSLSRFVKYEVPGPKPARPRSPRLSQPQNRYVAEGRTKYRKGVKPVAEMKQLLTSGHNNVKIGRDVRKGRLKGYWVYILTLEERATCPSTCFHWETCYGNNMPFSKRADHNDPAFLSALSGEIDVLCNKHDGKVLVRLHALGDFYSTEYVRFWRDQLLEHPRLCVFGYTAHPRHTAVGAAVWELFREFNRRAMIRTSDGVHDTMATRSIVEESECPKDAFVCPEQTGKTRACATCGACWSVEKNVAFLQH